MAKKLKLPKRIAGVKIPKPVRKGPVGRFFGSPAGQLLLAEALVFAGGVFAARRSDLPMRTAGGASRRDALQEASARFSYAFGEAMKAFRSALHEGPEGGDAASVSPERHEERERARTKAVA